MKDYDPYLEGSSERDTNQPNGVSEDPRNEGWGHRSEIARNSAEKAKQKSISAVVNDRRNGKTHTTEEPNPSSHEQQQQDRPKSDNHGESNASDYPYGKPLSMKEKAAVKHGDHWSDEKKRNFLENKTTLSAEQLEWDV